MPANTPLPQRIAESSPEVSLSDFAVSTEETAALKTATSTSSPALKPYSRSTLLIVAFLSGVGVAVALVLVLTALYFAGLVKI